MFWELFWLLVALSGSSFRYLSLSFILIYLVRSFLTDSPVKYYSFRTFHAFTNKFKFMDLQLIWFQPKANACPTYGATALIGAGSSIMLIMSLSMTADLIGVHTVIHSCFFPFYVSFAYGF